VKAAIFRALGGCLLTIVALFCVGASSQSPATKDTSAGDAQKGQELYTSYGCYECHGRQGQGARTSGPRLGPGPISFPAFSRYVRQPRGQMPPYTSKVVSDGDLADIYAFLKSLPKPPAEKDIPLLN
jgi:ubiquinol-cytochrome c reductase cytochrome c subunit